MSGAGPRAAIDVERLVQWALAPGREGGFRWRGDAALAFDGGLTAKPRRKPRGSWALIEAGAGAVTGRQPAVALQPSADPDAALVLAAVEALPSDAAALVLFHGRRRTRPRWTERQARLTPRWAAPGRPKVACQDAKRRRQPYCVLDLEIRDIVTPSTRRGYALWHEALAAVAARLGATELARWRVVPTPAPPAQPWRDGPPSSARVYQRLAGSLGAGAA